MKEAVTNAITSYLDFLLVAWRVIRQFLALIMAGIGVAIARVWFAYRKATAADEDRVRKRKYLSKIQRRPQRNNLVEGDPNYPDSMLPEEIVIRPPEDTTPNTDLDVFLKVHMFMLNRQGAMFFMFAFVVLPFQVVVGSVGLYCFIWKLYLAGYLEITRPDLLVRETVTSFFGTNFFKMPESNASRLGIKVTVNAYAPGLLVYDMEERATIAAKAGLMTNCVIEKISDKLPPPAAEPPAGQAQGGEAAKKAAAAAKPVMRAVNDVQTFEARLAEAFLGREEEILIKLAGSEPITLRLIDRPAAPTPTASSAPSPSAGDSAAAGVQGKSNSNQGEKAVPNAENGKDDGSDDSDDFTTD